jgi:hypothetical protein
MRTSLRGRAIGVAGRVKSEASVRHRPIAPLKQIEAPEPPACVAGSESKDGVATVLAVRAAAFVGGGSIEYGPVLGGARSGRIPGEENYSTELMNLKNRRLSLFRTASCETERGNATCDRRRRPRPGPHFRLPWLRILRQTQWWHAPPSAGRNSRSFAARVD